MQQLRLGTTVRAQVIGNPFSRLVATTIGLLVVLSALAVFLCVVVPILGVVLSAAVGGVILTVVGLMMMVPLLIIAGTIVALWGRGRARNR